MEQVSDGLGMEGRVVAEGCLECSGNYVVEVSLHPRQLRSTAVRSFRNIVFTPRMKEWSDDGAMPLSTFIPTALKV